MFTQLVRRPLTQSPRYLRPLADLPSAALLRERFRRDPRRSLSTRESETTNSPPGGPIFSAGSDIAKLSAAYNLLTENHSWELINSRQGISKVYSFRSYTKNLDFALSVGRQGNYKNHHPTIIIKPSSVKVTWATHVPRGLSEKDIDMAKFCDEQAEKVSALSPKNQTEKST
ncbi:hypothetical protein PISL3812_00643 [Talaromyces islandicus]|uniref:4a-hydroxytetrahydrobiopterin dehydratase n=1 Tax=Talaromyces islandicus TaxID=28573 RepID=A0A0U1LKJ3_TALIS|nr:hypothetical protein PISL3812_00643 [Talaromyces islandicus]